MVFLVSKWENAFKNIRGTNMKTKKNKQYNAVLEEKLGKQQYLLNRIIVNII